MLGKKIAAMKKAGDYDEYRVLVPERQVWIRVYTAVFRFSWSGNRAVMLGKHNIYTQGVSSVFVAEPVFAEICAHVAAIAKDRFRSPAVNRSGTKKEPFRRRPVTRPLFA